LTTLKPNTTTCSTPKPSRCRIRPWTSPRTQQRYDAAYARLLSLQTGAASPAVISAAKALDQAKSALSQAEANLSLVEAQIAKLTVNAPMDGVILTRNVEPGEFVQPGAIALTMADLTNLTITVYVPEDRYGRISLGQTPKSKWIHSPI
jgi:HlyD family secretion protein